MDADDALDVLDDLSESKKNEIVSHLDADAQKDVQKLLSYEEDEIGSCMTNNFVCISEELSVREAMSELVRQAGEHDNISTIYVTDTEDTAIPRNNSMISHGSLFFILTIVGSFKSSSEVRPASFA